MQKFETFTGIAAPLSMDNIDTDIIIPARFLKTIKRTGLGKFAFSNIRYNDDGSEKKEFVLNQEPYRKAQILIAGDNFGCGSSREHAPWALLDFGIRCVISTSFADIFFNNCFKNGILPIKVTQDQLDALMEDTKGHNSCTMTIDLFNQKIIRANGEAISFDVDAFRKHCLINGLDDIGLTLQKSAKVEAYETKQKQEQPWLWTQG